MSPQYEPFGRAGAEYERDYFSPKPMAPGMVETPASMTPAAGSPAPLAVDRSASTRSLGMRSQVLSTIPHSPSKLRWVKGELIGKGSFGSVFHGLNLDTGEFMAVKQVPLIHPKVKDETAASRQRQKFVEALRNEIELLTGIQHDNVVRYLGFEVTSEHVNVFLEYVSGGSIASMLGEIGQFDEPLIRSLVYQILCGLEYLHARGIMHRDIKGANILLDEQGTAKITDFGISKKSEMAYKWNSRMSVQGSVYWMAPEVIRGKGYSAKVDIWSLGCLALEMFTGQHPWSQFQDQTAALYRLGQPNPRPMIPTYLSAEAQDFLDKCFTFDPEARPTAAELLEHKFCDLDESFNYTDYIEEQKARILDEEEEEMEAEYYDDDTGTIESEPMDLDSELGQGFAYGDDFENDTTYMPLAGTGSTESGTGTYQHTPALHVDGVLDSTMRPPLPGGASGSVDPVYMDSGWLSGGLATGPDGDADDDAEPGKVVSIDDEAGLTPTRAGFELDQQVPSDGESLTPTTSEFPRRND
ncbi:kinase-like domain-containing protein [Hyaloraphidium curvatum]|nr:kinase-like domain-containing protein [Hyaloraphidium curvatum]